MDDDGFHICWYSHWGWPIHVADIYKRAVAELGDSIVLYGPSHIIFADDNLERCHVERCVKYCDDPNAIDMERDHTPKAIARLKCYLLELLALPDMLLCPQPEDYDGMHPANYPPAVEMTKRY